MISTMYFKANNACRTPWRIGTEALLSNRDAAGLTLLKRILYGRQHTGSTLPDAAIRLFGSTAV